MAKLQNIMILVNMAKQGNRVARDELLKIYMEDMRKAYDFGPEGTHPRDLGYSYNFKGLTFSENSGIVFEWFDRAIQKYDASMGMSFKSFLLQEIYFRSKDGLKKRAQTECVEIPESTLYRHVSKDELEEYGFFDLLQKDRAEEIFEEEQHQMECADLCNFIESKFPEGSNERRYIKLYRELGQIYKNPTTQIAEVMGVSRQSVNLYKKNIQNKIAKLSDELGSHFFMAA